jgi:carbon-monoxide dehydrogenase medium subunit
VPTPDYKAATSIAEVLDLLGQYGDEAHLMAGGTSVMLMMAQNLLQPELLVGIRNVAELKGIRRLADGGLEIGALTSIHEAEISPDVHAFNVALAETFGHVASIRIRNQGTLGGNLAHADPAQDPPVTLLALDAVAVIQSAAGERTMPLDEFFVDYFETALQPTDLLKSVRIPALAANAKTTYVKFLPRTVDDYATVSVATNLRLNGDVCEDVRITLGAAATVPLRAKAVEDALRGQRLTADLIKEAAALVRDEVDPIDDSRGTASYKREMARVWTERSLKHLAFGDALGMTTRRTGNSVSERVEVTI